MIDLTESRRICEAATPGPWLDKSLPKDSAGWSTCMVIAAFWQGESGRIYAEAPKGKFPSADKRFTIHARTALPEALDELAAARARVAELEAEVERLRSGGRYIATCLGGASCGRGGWTREEVRRLFEHVCREWPEFNPRLTAEAAKEGP